MRGGSRKDWQGGLSLAQTMVVKRFPYLPCFVHSRRIAQTVENHVIKRACIEQTRIVLGLGSRSQLSHPSHVRVTWISTRFDE